MKIELNDASVKSRRIASMEKSGKWHFRLVFSHHLIIHVESNDRSISDPSLDMPGYRFSLAHLFEARLRCPALACAALAFVS
jgi:hypothetical protein